MEKKSPITKIQVRLGGQSGKWLQGNNELRMSINDRLAEAVQSLMLAYGIPGSVESVVEQSALSLENHDVEWVVLAVNDAACPITLKQVGRIAGWSVRELPFSWNIWQEADDWLIALLKKTESDQSQVLDFVVSLITDSLIRHPHLFLTPEHAKKVFQELLIHIDNGQSLLSLEQVYPAMQLVLGGRFTLSDRQRIAQLLHRFLGETPYHLDAAEHLRNELRANAVEIVVNPEYLQALTLADTNASEARFTRMRNELRLVSGIVFPPFRFTLDESMPVGSFAFRIGDLLGTPWVGYASGNASDALDYIGKCLAVELGDNRHCFVDLSLVKSLTDQIGAIQSRLVELVNQRLRSTEVVRVLRTLLERGESLQNLRLILEALVCFDTVESNDTDGWVPGERMPVKQRATPDTPEYTSQLVDFVIWWRERALNSLFMDSLSTRANTLQALSVLERFAEPPSASGGAVDMSLVKFLQRYPKDVLQNIFPMILIASKPDMETLPKEMQDFMLEFFKKIGVQGGMDGEQVNALLEKYYRENQMDPMALKDLEDYLQSKLHSNSGKVPANMDAYTAKMEFKYWAG